MTKTLIGLAIFVSGAIVYGFTLIAASIYAQVLADTSWDGRYGIFGTALREIGTAPLTVAIILGITGIYFMILSVKNDKRRATGE